jgi:pilus assembly protein CpaF
MEGDVITLQDVFLFDFSAGVDDQGRFKGQLKPTGVRPKFAEKLANNGIKLGPEMFAPQAVADAARRVR